jgi:hypothetical protein
MKPSHVEKPDLKQSVNLSEPSRSPTRLRSQLPPCQNCASVPTKKASAPITDSARDISRMILIFVARIESEVHADITQLPRDKAEKNIAAEIEPTKKNAALKLYLLA